MTSSKFLVSTIDDDKAVKTSTTHNFLVVPALGRRSPRTGQLNFAAQEHLEHQADAQKRRSARIARGQLAQAYEDVGVPRSLANLRLRCGLSQKELADAIGTSQSHVAKMEAGSVNILLSTAAKVAEALNVTVDDVWKATNVKPLTTFKLIGE